MSNIWIIILVLIKVLAMISFLYHAFVFIATKETNVGIWMLLMSIVMLS